MVAYAARPIGLPGCWSAWSENDMPVSIRTQMESGLPKVRRRFTGVYRQAEVSLDAPPSILPPFMDWFRISCQQGIMPTAMFEPDGTESVWRFMAPPRIAWPSVHRTYVTISCAIERLPGWQVL